MIYLAREVKDELLPLHQIIHRMRIPHIAEIHMNLVGNLFHVEQIPSQPRYHIIDNGYMGS